MKYVIIGNSAAAVGCIEGIRKVDFEGEILLISDEKHFTYSRPLISYWLSGKVTDANMSYRPADFYKKNKVDCILGVRVNSINSKDKTLSLSDGSTVSYDKLRWQPVHVRLCRPFRVLMNVTEPAHSLVLMMPQSSKR